MVVDRYRQFPESLAPGIVGANVVGESLVEISGGASQVVDVRGCLSFTAWAASGTHTYQPCDEDGNALPGSSSANFTVGTSVEPAAPFYLVTAAAGVDLTIARN